MRKYSIKNFRNLFLFTWCALVQGLSAQEKMPSKSEFDSVMMNAVKQMNAQMSGARIDNYTNLKYVTYDLNPPLFSYFYTSSALIANKQITLNQAQIDAMRSFNVSKTCSAPLQPLMKPYGLKIAHIFEDKKLGE